ncbi:hypothetical protein GCM10027280_45220 [Micromonospora polyrhachis]|uniref:Uncharacterized protein n=1 Tax=Micromonospora polyrhachis TaxID=1282883 RepID=A0A7W7SQA1_9ACTN|nr:hypothetical protein [Micromonospora polyrhachis]
MAKSKKPKRLCMRAGCGYEVPDGKFYCTNRCEARSEGVSLAVLQEMKKRR